MNATTLRISRVKQPCILEIISSDGRKEIACYSLEVVIKPIWERVNPNRSGIVGFETSLIVKRVFDALFPEFPFDVFDWCAEFEGKRYTGKGVVFNQSVNSEEAIDEDGHRIDVAMHTAEIRVIPNL